MATPKTVITYTLDGTTREFDIPFQYLARRFVVVTLTGTGLESKLLVMGTDYRFATKTRIFVSADFGAFSRLEVRRVTSATDRVVDFSDGSILRAFDLNTAQLQSLHVAEEGREQTIDLAKGWADESQRWAEQSEDSAGEALDHLNEIKALGGMGNTRDDNVAVTQPFTNTKTRSQHAFNAEAPRVTDWGADPLMVIDSTTAFNQAARDAKSFGFSKVIVPAGRYKLTDTLDIPAGVTFVGEGVAYWDTYRPAPDRLLKAFDTGTHLVFHGTGQRKWHIDNISNARPVKTIAGVLCEFTHFTNRDSVNGSAATPRQFSVAVRMTNASQLQNLRVVPEFNGIAGYNDTTQLGLGADWDVGIWVFDGSTGRIDNVQTVGYWRMAGLLMTEGDGSVNFKGNPEAFIVRNLFAQGMRGMILRNMPQIDVLSHTATTAVCRFDSSWNLSSTMKFRISGSTQVFSYTGQSVSGSEITLTGITPNLPATVGVLRYVNIGNNFSGTDFINCKFNSLDHISGKSSAELGVGEAAALEIDGFPMRNIRFSGSKTQTTQDKINFLFGDMRDAKFTSCESENGIGIAYSLAETQGYTGNMRWVNSDLQSTMNLSGFNPRDFFCDNLQIPTAFTNGDFIMKNWRATSLDIQWSTGASAFTLAERTDGGFQFNTKDGVRALNINGTTKDFTVRANNGAVIATGDNTNVFQWFGPSGNMSFKGNLSPVVHNTKSLGTGTLSWNKVYAVNGVDQTSDGRKKTARVLSDAEISAGLELATSYMGYTWDDLSDDLTHFGIIAQHVIQVFADNGLDALKYGVVTYSAGITSEEEGSVPFDFYTVNYGELSSLCIRALAYKVLGK